MPPRPLILLFMCLILHDLPFVATSMAGEATKTVRLDGKTLYIPEVKLTRPTNPVTSLIFLGAFEGGAGNNKNPLCAIDSRKNEIHIKSTGRLLENSKPRVITRNNAGAFLDSITWGRQQTTYIAFQISSARRQSVMIQINTDSSSTLYHNNNFISNVSADNVRANGGCGYLPVALQPGKNLIMLKLASARDKPWFELAVSLEHSQDLPVAWQARGFLKKLLYMPEKNPDDTPALTWNLDDFFPSLEIRDVSTDKIVFQKESVRQGRIFDDEDQPLALPPGVYEAIYRAGDESASEEFLIGNPHDLFAQLQDTLSKYSPDSESKLDIEAQLLRAQILLNENNYMAFDRQFQEKIVYTLNSLTTIARKLKEGGVNIAKAQPGLHIRTFVSAADGSAQNYRIFFPSTTNPAEPLPLLVLASTRVQNKRPFIEGPVMANHREALRWAQYGEKYGFALLWPGYRSVPGEGYSYENVYINECIQAVERDYAIDNQRISIYATCGAGYGAGRLVSEYNNRFAAIVYDRAVFDLSLDRIQSSRSLMEWYATINPSRHVIANRNLRIFVMHDNTTPPGHGPMELTTAFLDKAAKTRNDVVSYLSDRPMTTSERRDMIFSWLAPCQNEKPDDKRSYFLAKAGYTGPIMEIFATPILVVEGTGAQGGELENIKSVMESFKKDYANYFHGAQCAVKKDTEVTQEDIKTHSLVLLGNPKSNSVWEKLQPQLPVKVTPAAVLYENATLTGTQPFQAIVRHPTASDRYVLLIGASDLRTLERIPTGNLFWAWYDAITVSPRKIISKLDSLREARANTLNPENSVETPTPPKMKSRGPQKKATKPQPAK